MLSTDGVLGSITPSRKILGVGINFGVGASGGWVIGVPHSEIDGIKF
jgi:hypothetical protein